MCSSAEGFDELSRHPVEVGQRTEAVIICELVRLGYRVLLPFGFNNRYDLVLHVDDRFIRVQCKTGRLRNGVIIFPACSTRSSRTALHTRGYRGDIDLFIVHCAETGGTYAVPADEVSETAGYLRVSPPGNGQVKGVRWAKDYDLTVVGLN